MTLPQRIRGPRSAAARKAGGYSLQQAERREPKVQRRSPAHCDFVRDHNCIVPDCLRRPIEVAHVRTGTDGALGIKPSDCWIVSLCGADLDSEGHHREQHRIGEPAFEAKYGVDMKQSAIAFIKASPARAKVEPMLQASSLIREQVK